MAQTQIQNESAVRAGSFKCELSNDGLSWVDIGALRDLSLESKSETVNLSFDNVPDIKKYKKGNVFALKGNSCEINCTNLALMNGGQIVTSNVAGTLVSGHLQTIASGFSLNASIELNGQNANGNAPTIVSVVGSVDGAMVAGTDYELVKVASKWTIVFLTGTTTAQTVAVTYDYTPATKKLVTFNATGIKSGVFMRLTNVNENNDQFVVNMKGVVNIAPTTFNVAGDTEDNVAEMPLELEGEVISIEDFQQTI